MDTTIVAIGILLLIIGGAILVVPNLVWWGIIVAALGVILAAYDWLRTQK